MTLVKRKDEIEREIVGLQSLVEATPDDPLAKPLLESRISALRHELAEAEGNDANPGNRTGVFRCGSLWFDRN